MISTLPLLTVLQFYLLVSPTHVARAATAALPVAKPSCPDSCGEIPIPYPFGTLDGCYAPGFKIRCVPSDGHFRVFLDNTTIEATGIFVNNSTLTIAYTNIVKECYNRGMNLTEQNPSTIFDIGDDLPYAISPSDNTLIAVGCDALALYSGGEDFETACISLCNNQSTLVNGTCAGTGCCQSSVPKRVKSLLTVIGSIDNHTTSEDMGQCSYAFMVDKHWYSFTTSDLKSFNYSSVPVVLDWAIGGNQTCSAVAAAGDEEARCGANTTCFDYGSGPGYQCTCLEGYEGNPYLSSGCQDIDECGGNIHNCSDLCTNKLGSYSCSCPTGSYGDGRKEGKGCIRKNKKFPLASQIILGIAGVILVIFFVLFYLYWANQKKKLVELRKKYFEENGGPLLETQMSRRGVEATVKIFSEDELRAATDNFSETRVLGCGGNGIVYKGFLPDDRVVAIKRSKAVDKSQMTQFVNEVVILSQVIHKNVVKILGWCLETQVPLLVYEYIPNQTLFYHIHGEEGTNYVSMLSWRTRVRIAMETANAIAYLHWGVQSPIVHRDIKTANILLDRNFTAKVSDFGASRLVATSEEDVTTMIQGTLGYLDPEYFQTGQLTDKSDVYSFGVVLVELLTGKKPISFTGEPELSNLAAFFLLSMKENRLVQILDPRVSREGEMEEVMAVAQIAKTCLKLKSDERPNMKEVANGLEKLMGQNNRPWQDENMHDGDGKLILQDTIMGHHGGASGAGETGSSFGDIMWTMELER